mmetsp:Transcript_12379/g.32359  ORF Transcript_12379/g.32359 Transcript_12379/m.32359 type:complete len:153 (-) Transcript_12379:6-464(-)
MFQSIVTNALGVAAALSPARMRRFLGAAQYIVAFTCAAHFADYIYSAESIDLDRLPREDKLELLVESSRSHRQLLVVCMLLHLATMVLLFFGARACMALEAHLVFAAEAGEGWDDSDDDALASSADDDASSRRRGVTFVEDARARRGPPPLL